MSSSEPLSKNVKKNVSPELSVVGAGNEKKNATLIHQDGHKMADIFECIFLNENFI